MVINFKESGMNHFVKKHYHLISYTLLLIIFFAWVFLQNYMYSDSTSAISADGKETVTEDTVNTGTADNAPVSDAHVQSPLNDTKTDSDISDSGNDSDSAEAVDVSSEAASDPSGYESEGTDRSDNTSTDIETTENIDAEAEPVKKTVEEIDLEEGSYGPGEGKMPFDLCLANVHESLNVRSGPGEDNEVIAKFLPVDYARVVEKYDDWSLISSGEITGYCHNDYLITGDKALKKFIDKDKLTVTVTHKLINIRAAKSTDAEILRQAKMDESFKCIPSESDSNWFAIKYDDGNIAYVATTLAHVTAEMDNIDSLTPVG